MAFAVASKGASSASLLKNLRRLVAAPSSSLIAPASSVTATRRLFHRNYYYYAAPPSTGDQLVLNHQQLLAPHSVQPMFFTPTACIWWVKSKEVGDAVEVTVAIPGLAKEHVKVWTNEKDLFVGVKGTDDAAVQDLAGRTPPYSCHVEFPAGEVDLGKVKAEMKHGLLKITVPRVFKGSEVKIE